jgi:WD40 repeat protein
LRRLINYFVVQDVKLHGSGIRVMFLVDKDRLATGASENFFNIWDVKSGELLRTIGPIERMVMKFLQLENGHLVCQAFRQTTIWDTYDGRLIKKIPTDMFFTYIMRREKDHFYVAGLDERGPTLYTAKINSSLLEEKLKIQAELGFDTILPKGNVIYGNTSFMQELFYLLGERKVKTLVLSSYKFNKYYLDLLQNGNLISMRELHGRKNFNVWINYTISSDDPTITNCAINLKNPQSYTQLENGDIVLIYKPGYMQLYDQNNCQLKKDVFYFMNPADTGEYNVLSNNKGDIMASSNFNTLRIWNTSNNSFNLINIFNFTIKYATKRRFDS